MSQQDVITTVERIATPLMASLGMEMVDIEYRREGRDMILRIFLDKEGGITLDDCAEASRELSAILDVEDVIPGHYNLEVSSPGLDRPLKKESDYEKFRGRLIKVKTYEPLPDDKGNKRKTFLGTLEGLENGEIVLHLKEGQDARIPLVAAAKVNLEFEF